MTHEFFTDQEPVEATGDKMLKLVGIGVMTDIASRRNNPNGAFEDTAEIEKVAIAKAREITGEMNLSDIEVKINKEES